MAGPNAQPGGGEASPISAPVDLESGQWAALQQELEGDDALLEEAPPEPLKPDPQARAKAPKEGEGEDGEPRPKPTYDELEGNYRNTTVALRQARQAEKDAREQLTRFTTIMEEVRARRQEQPAEQAPQPKEISVEEDPIGYFQQELAKRDQRIEQLTTGTQQNVEQVRQHQQNLHFIQAVERSEVAQRQSTPDYDQACEHLEQGRIAELAIMVPDNSPHAMAMARRVGLQSPEQLRMHMLNQDRIGIARMALESGRSPAQAYYELAKSRGYTPAQLNGKAQGRAAPQSKAELALETAKRGQKASRSIGGGSGDADNDLNVAELADLYEEDPEAFDKAWEKAARSGKLG